MPKINLQVNIMSDLDGKYIALCSDFTQDGDTLDIKTVCESLQDAKNVVIGYLEREGRQ